MRQDRVIEARHGCAGRALSRRAVAYTDRARVRCISRNGVDHTRRFPTSPAPSWP